MKNGNDAETAQIDALPNCLRIKLIINHLDRKDDVKLYQIIYGYNDSSKDIHLLFKPGHYDVLHIHKY